MLILVAVTINVAMQGGLFTKARDAADQTQVEADRESLLMAAMACIGPNGNIVFSGADGGTGISGGTRYDSGRKAYRLL